MVARRGSAGSAGRRPTRRTAKCAARPLRSPRSASAGLADVLRAVWRQIFVDGLAEVSIGRRRVPVGFTKTKHLRAVEVPYGRYRLFGIEQNPRTSSRWAKLARQGKRIMQFSYGGRYVANVGEDVLYRYPAWGAMKLPE
ncbi:MAG TPA: hypothetical protein VGX97_11715 [bacterium]|nr:hypothetical protein [bacterium]